MCTYDDLPTVTTCCGRRLRIGCLLIAVLGVLYNSGAFCTVTGTGYQLMGAINVYLKVAVVISKVIFGTFSLILFVGVLDSHPDSVLWWLTAALQNVIVELVLGILLIYVNVIRSSEGDSWKVKGANWSNALQYTAFPCIWTYFILVVNSYRLQLIDDEF